MTSIQLATVIVLALVGATVPEKKVTPDGITQYIPYPGDPPDYFEAEKDLDGDGKNEKIVLNARHEIPYLYVNEVSTAVSLVPRDVVYLQIHDIDSTDQRFELEVGGARVDAPTMWHIFSWTGKSISLEVSGSEDTTIIGNGIVLNKYRPLRSHYFSIVKKFKVGKQSGKLEYVPQEFYSVEHQKVTVTKSIPVYYKRGTKQLVGNSAPNSEVRVLLVEESCGLGMSQWDKNPAFKCKWILIKTSTGLTGWVTIDDLNSNSEGFVSHAG